MKVIRIYLISHISGYRALPRDRPMETRSYGHPPLKSLRAAIMISNKNQTKGTAAEVAPHAIQIFALPTIMLPWAPLALVSPLPAILCCLLTCSHQAGADKAHPFSERFNCIHVKPRFPWRPFYRHPVTSQNVLYSDAGKKTKRASGKFLNKLLRAGHAMQREGTRHSYKRPDSKMVPH